MAISVPWGFDNVSTEGAFSRWAHHAALVNYKHGVSAGGAVTAAAAPRGFSVAPFTAVVAGALVESSATEVRSAAAFSGTGYRHDILALEVNYQANTANLVVVQGSSATAPTLTQVEGGIWQMPLASAFVRSTTTGVFPSVDIFNRTPKPLRTYLYSGTIATGTYSRTSTDAIIANMAIPDVGWPYHLKVSALVNMSADNGAVILSAQARVEESTSTYAPLGEAITPNLANATTNFALRVQESNYPVFRGRSTARITLSTTSMTSGSVSVNRPQFSHFVVEQIPASALV